MIGWACLKIIEKDNIEQSKNRMKHSEYLLKNMI